ncbi:hypothetical protein LMJ38_34920 [Streptomyces sp. R1]|uniref:hypothetical protein n=1 Tax=unclassified Streptomyces TaxID=2593676 RepID=UPI001E39528C|nr:hypothetical protein [Streptomyces sp. R1]MCC8341085.1 hypothetical protein [Streptomyces sp. R1]
MPSKSPRLTFAVLASGAGVFSMLQSLIAPALPTIQHALHTSQKLFSISERLRCD